jgi:hypothetical protein
VSRDTNVEQTIPEDGISDGGDAYTQEELDQINQIDSRFFTVEQVCVYCCPGDKRSGVNHGTCDWHSRTLARHVQARKQLKRIGAFDLTYYPKRIMTHVGYLGFVRAATGYAHTS